MPVFFPSSLFQEVTCLEFHPREQILVSGSRDYTVKFFDYSKPSVKRAFKTIHVSQVDRIIPLSAFSILFFLHSASMFVNILKALTNFFLFTKKKKKFSYSLNVSFIQQYFYISLPSQRAYDCKKEYMEVFTRNHTCWALKFG